MQCCVFVWRITFNPMKIMLFWTSGLLPIGTLTIFYTTSMKTALLAMIGCLAFAAEIAPTQVPVNVTHEKGSFSGQLLVNLDGTLNKAKAQWNATVKNTSPHSIFRVTFCIRAFDASGQQIKAGEDECAIRLWGTNWKPGVPLNFKGKQNVKFSEDKTPFQAVKYTIDAVDVFDHAPNLRYMEARCPLVWSSAIRVFADKKFRPTVMDKESFTATFAYDAGMVKGYDSKNMLKSFTTANTAFMGPTWEAFRIDSASLYLREDKPGLCTAEVKMSYAGFGKPFMGRYGWFAVDSNFNLEKVLMDELEAQSKKAVSNDLDKAISQLPYIGSRTEG